MTSQSQIKISETLSIPVRELKFAASRSSGPGGQNVNKVSTRITLWFDVVTSPSLSDRQKELIQDRLQTRMNKDGILRVVSQKHRTQAANRNAAIERFALLLQEALQEELPRRETKIPKSARESRLDEKKHRSRIKERRSKKISLTDWK
ncbi:MAG TPA: alternative ribosome rescue aminoacyl-tRNA hydrolase ArfB [Desulfobacteraceae bacterium]|nr:alternative ribosome rescue aminoacyl-tRNA hydrolase ArfB [Desulfobacteraceae bacterium]HPQ27122.1 alternative ribosome rescue aminoacyl-tRNA hydrolase ArfB [Desulfobacteraceae bacterium]